MIRFVCAVCALVILLKTTHNETARASIIVNGDFEAWDDSNEAPNDWLENPTAGTGPQFEQAPGLDGSVYSLQINPGLASARGIYQDFTPLDTFEISMDFAAEDPGVPDGDHRALRVTVRGGSGTPGTPIVNLRVIGNGDFQMFSGSWGTIPGGAGAVNFSDFATGDLTVYRLTISGTVNTGDSSTLSQSIRLFDVTNNNLVLEEDLGTGLWQTTPTTLPVHRLFFESTNALEASYRVDNVSVVVPEPQSIALAGLALIGLGIVRRRAASR